MDDEVMRFEITDQDLEDEMATAYGKKRYNLIFSLQILSSKLVGKT